MTECHGGGGCARERAAERLDRYATKDKLKLYIKTSGFSFVDCSWTNFVDSTYDSGPLLLQVRSDSLSIGSPPGCCGITS